MKAISCLALLGLIACASRRPPTSDNPIDNVLLSKYTDYRKCYMNSDAYKKNPLSKKFSMRLDLVINQDGSVKDEKVASSDVKDPEFEKCILGHIRSLKFPGRDKETLIHQPLSFYIK